MTVKRSSRAMGSRADAKPRPSSSQAGVSAEEGLAPPLKPRNVARNQNGGTPKVDRIEVIDEQGTAYARYGGNIRLSYQDGGRTLKVFVTEEKKVRPAVNPRTGKRIIRLDRLEPVTL